MSAPQLEGPAPSLVAVPAFLARYRVRHLWFSGVIYLRSMARSYGHYGALYLLWYEPQYHLRCFWAEFNIQCDAHRDYEIPAEAVTQVLKRYLPTLAFIKLE